MGGPHVTPAKSVVAFDELHTADRFRVLWGFFWRAVLTTIASALGGGIAGFILGFILGIVGHASGWPIESIRSGAAILGGIAGMIIGLIFFWQYIRWLFRAKWRGYQLRLVRSE